MDRLGLSRATWRKSARSGDNGGQCIEAAHWGERAVAIRDSKDPDGPKLAVTPRAWNAFLGGVNSGELDR